MKDYIKRLSQRVLEKYRFKFSVPVRAFLEKHYLLERKPGVYSVPLSISHTMFQSIDSNTRSEVLSENMIERLWGKSSYLMKYGYMPNLKTLSIYYLARTGDVDRIHASCEYMYRDMLPSIQYMEEVIKKIKKESILFFFEKASIVK